MTSHARRLVSGTAALLLLIAGLLLTPPAEAASHDGALRVRGPGFAYSGSATVAEQTVAAGSSATFDVQVVNKGISPARFNLKVLQSGTIPPATVTLSTGLLNLQQLVAGPDGYSTASIAAGRTQTISMRVTIPSGTPQGTDYVTVWLYSTDGTPLDRVTGDTEVKAPTYGTTAYDLFVKNAGQSYYVGGSLNGQAAGSAALQLGSSTTFNIKLQNDGTAPARIGGLLDPEGACATFTVRDGFTDVTAAMVAGTYLTPVLAVHGSKSLTVTATRTSLTGCSLWDQAGVSALDQATPDEHFSYLVVPIPVS